MNGLQAASRESRLEEGRFLHTPPNLSLSSSSSSQPKRKEQEDEEEEERRRRTRERPGGIALRGSLDTPCHLDSPSRLDEPISDTIKRDVRNVTRKLLCVVYKNPIPRSLRSLRERRRSGGGGGEEEEGGGRRRTRRTSSSNSFLAEADAADLRQWDLCGPLLLCLFLSVVLYIQASFSFPSTLPSSSSRESEEEEDVYLLQESMEVLRRHQRERQRVAFSLVYVFVSLGATIVSLNAKLLGSKLSFFQSVCILGYCLFPLDVAAFCNLFVPKSFSLLKLFISFLALPWSVGASVSFLSGDMIGEEKRGLAVYPVCLFYFAMTWIISSV